jgi:hypothetical protein
MTQGSVGSIYPSFRFEEMLRYGERLLVAGHLATLLFLKKVPRGNMQRIMTTDFQRIDFNGHCRCQCPWQLPSFLEVQSGLGRFADYTRSCDAECGRSSKLNIAPLVGSRTGAGLRRFGLSISPRFLWECLTSRTVSRFPVPATSNPSCRFPAMGLPARFRSRVM